MRALDTYGPPGRKTEFGKRIARARDWLAAAKPATKPGWMVNATKIDKVLNKYRTGKEVAGDD